MNFVRQSYEAASAFPSFLIEEILKGLILKELCLMIAEWAVEPNLYAFEKCLFTLLLCYPQELEGKAKVFDALLEYNGFTYRWLERCWPFATVDREFRSYEWLSEIVTVINSAECNYSTCYYTEDGRALGRHCRCGHPFTKREAITLAKLWREY